MTEQKAIEKLNMMDEALNFQRRDADECSQALQMAIESIEKQIPKKIDVINSIHHYCPFCGLYFDSRDWKSKYCGRCGQSLKWE